MSYSKINRNAFFDELILMYLYTKKEVNADNIEELFGDIKDTQNVNNVVSNRINKPSYLYNNTFIEYNEKTKILKITNKGREYIEKKFPPIRRVYKTNEF
ncbi:MULTISPECIES: hypothetical protein [unclassified Campylobacter]|uniref:hypothetical protein n=1 Tax=unclassified Campylobacter TaxID=2593542 RepID=UPI001DF4BC6D|nr:hypothetical protein [Campylobacter sp. RM9331]MBZ8005876.1 hypothetical protein [Campylobacter sp. RM9332]